MTEKTFIRTVLIHRGKMCRFARSLLADDEDSFDAVQDVMEKLWRYRSELSNIGNVEAFAMKCLRHEAMNRLRRLKVIHAYQNTLTEGVEREKYPSLMTELISSL